MMKIIALIIGLLACVGAYALTENQRKDLQKMYKHKDKQGIAVFYQRYQISKTCKQFYDVREWHQKIQEKSLCVR